MTQTNRFYFLDAIRGFVLFLMLEVHVFNELLHTDSRFGLGFTIMNFINGLVAPTFLFSAGFSFALFYHKKHLELTPKHASFWRQLGRIGFIWLIGYQIHMPYFSLTQILGQATPDQWLQFFGLDILQCIAAGLLLLFLLYLLLPTLRKINLSLGLLALLFLLASPFFYLTPLGSSLPLALQVYFKPIHYSYFPLLPWLSFLFLGALFGNIFLSASDEKRQRLMKLLLISGAILAALATFLLIVFQNQQIIRDVRPHTLFFLSRLGFVFLFYAIGYYWGKKRALKNNVLVITGQFSLLFYWLHLQVIYRHFFPGGKSLADLYSKSLGFPTILLITLGAGILLFFTLLGYRWLKGRFPKTTSYLTPGIFTLSLLVFLVN